MTGKKLPVLVFSLLIFLLAACAPKQEMGMTAVMPVGRAYAEGGEIYFMHTEASDADIAELLTNMMDSPVLHVPSLALVPEESLANVYVFTNGLEGMGPLGFAADVFDAPPGSGNYSPLRLLNLVTWADPALARELKSADQVMEAYASDQVTIEQNALVAAALRGEGFNAVELPIEDDTAYAEGRKWARGSECLPAPLTLGSFLKQAGNERGQGKDPSAGLAFFMPTSDGPCRFGQYCALDRIVLDRVGCRDLPILSPSSENAYYGIDQKVFEIILLADILFKLRCRTKPREKIRGDTEETLDHWMQKAEREIEQRRIRLDAFLPEAVRAFQRIPVDASPRVLVGVVGEIYVRCHAFANRGLVETIEQQGGEAWVAPTTEWIMYTAWVERYRLKRSGMGPWQAAKLALRWRYMQRKEHTAYRLAAALLSDRLEPSIDEIVAAGRKFLPPDFEGESILTLGRAMHFKHDGVGLIVNCAPFGCMHGNITSTLFNHAADEFDVPVVNIAYDGVGNANAIVETFMEAARSSPKFDPGTH